MEFESQSGSNHMTEGESSPPHQEPVFAEPTWTTENPGPLVKAFSASAHPDEDWTKISDLAERRRIQNRIAQRNYRKKIKERMADLERMAGSNKNDAGDRSSDKRANSSNKRRASSPPPGHQTLQPPQLDVPQHPFTPPMNPEDHFFPSPSPPSSSPPPSASYQPPYSPPSDNGMVIQPYGSLQETVTTTSPYQFGMLSTDVPTLPPMTHFADAYRAPNFESIPPFPNYGDYTLGGHLNPSPDNSHPDVTSLRHIRNHSPLPSAVLSPFSNDDDHTAPFAPYQPTNLPSSGNVLSVHAYRNPQQRNVLGQNKTKPSLNEPRLPEIDLWGKSSASGSSGPPTGHETNRDTESSTPRLDGPGDVIAVRLADPDSTQPSSPAKQIHRHPATFQCTLCPKRFTRTYNLRSHLRTHTDERPFACIICGKEFPGEHEKEQHERLHSGEKKFVCRGDLKSGGSWGCGRRFARADALGRHFRSEAGRACIMPLFDQEMLERQRRQQSLPYQIAAAAELRLPAALLAQYPGLAGNWVGDSNPELDDDRSRYDSSDYESDDAGYASGTEFGFGEKNVRGQASSYRHSRGAADESQVPRPDTPKTSRISSGNLGPEAALHGSDQPLLRGTIRFNRKESPPQESARPEGSQNQSQLHSHQSEREDLGKPEVSLPEITDSQHSDDDMSLHSFTESVFDMGSIVSSASSSHNNNHAMVSSFVDILIREPNMDSLLAITTSEFGSSSGRFTRNFSRILKSYSRHLQQAVEGSNLVNWDKYLIAARSVRSARHQVSNLIASRYKERAPTAQNLKHREVELISRHLNQPTTTDIEEPSSNEESSEDEVDLMMGDLKQFLVSGEPFRFLKRNLRSLVIPDEFLYYIYESVREFLDLILADTRPKSFARGLLHAITNGRDISSDLNLQLHFMAEEIKAECKDISQLDASIFLETYSQYISAVAIDQVKDSFITPSQSAQGASPIQGRGSDQKFSLLNTKRPMEDDPKPAIPHEDVLEQVVADTLPSVLYVDLLPHRDFLAGSAAFASFINSLRDLVYPNFVSEATRSVKATIRSAESSEERQLALEGQRLLPILLEMQSCLERTNGPMSFSTAQETDVTSLDRLKVAIETSTAAEWDWWPLQPPNRSKVPGRARISWQCSCGVQRHETTSPYYASKLESILNNFPLAPGDRSGSADGPKRSLSNASSQGARSTQSAESSSTNTGGEQSASSLASSINSAITAPDDGDDSVIDFGAGRRRYIYIFLLVKASEYTLDTIDVSSMKARDLFQALRSTYNKHRGLCRRAFSVFVYHHCDFIKIIKPEPDTFMPGELKFELPSDHDDEYQYRPRPTYSAPITKHIFRHYFYGCYDSSSLWHRLHACNPLTARCRIRNPAAELLDHIPKRDRPVSAAAQSEKVEVCYGLAARECRSFFRVVVYLCVIMAPAIWFVFAWLFMWGNQGDLQDATVPMTLVLAMLSILWAVVYSGSDVRKDYGDALN